MVFFKSDYNLEEINSTYDTLSEQQRKYSKYYACLDEIYETIPNIDRDEALGFLDKCFDAAQGDGLISGVFSYTDFVCRSIENNFISLDEFLNECSKDCLIDSYQAADYLSLKVIDNDYEI